MFKMILALLLAVAPHSKSLHTIYASLDPTSVAQHLAFYELYPETAEGREALKHAWELLSGGDTDSDPELLLPKVDLQSLVTFVNRTTAKAPILNEEQLSVIEKLSRHLGNRQLQGFGLWDPQTLENLPSEQIDLARGLFLAESGGEPDTRLMVRSYEANIDLMALQILARLSPNATSLEKVRAINDYIFGEMRFRFPPHSLWAKDIDVYTLLPSVLDSRQGVCLGVSILYICLAQRLHLPLEAITPPGHIYVRYVDEEGEITNIETTARGIDVPSEMYLGLETRKLKTRSVREVIGLAFMNQAAVCWHKENAEEAVGLYEKSQIFLPDEYLINMFLGYNYLFVGREDEGRALLEKVKDFIPDYAISGDTVAEDYLLGRTDVEGIQAIFKEVDERRTSILEKQQTLQEITEKYPEFRQGHFHLAITYLQLGREKEALPILEHYNSLHPDDATANYYLSVIYSQRLNYKKAWKYLLQAEEIVARRDHSPKALQQLRQSLQQSCPQPL